MTNESVGKGAKNRKGFVISTKEKSPCEARQRLDSRCGVTCGNFSFVNDNIVFKLYDVEREIVIKKA